MCDVRAPFGARPGVVCPLVECRHPAGVAPLCQEEVTGDRQQVALDRCQIDATARVPQADERLRDDVVRQGRIA